MARLKIPNYSPTARGSWVPQTDSSIDRDLFKRERDGLEAAGKDPLEHPLERYWCGEGRFDLDAVMDFDGRQVRPRDYLVAGEPPEVFSLRRLSWEEWNDVERIADQRTRYIRCCRLGVVAVDDSPLKLTVSGGMLTTESMQALHDADPSLPVNLGVAVYLYNLPPSAAEKKPAALGA